MNRRTFLDAVNARPTPGAVFGTGTSIACQELMAMTGAFFPEAHTNAKTMAKLAEAGHTVLGLDVVMPLFSVSHEAAGLGANVNWGSPSAMPEGGKPIFSRPDDIRIPGDFLRRPGCAVPLEAITLLKRSLGDAAAVCGKVMGPWTLAYHTIGVENFLVGTIDDPDGTKRILEGLLPATLQFAKAQVEAGADCLLLADHATRDLCSPAAYRDFLAELHSRIVGEIPVPLILHICGNTSDRIAMIARTGLACFHYDTKTGAPAAVRELAGKTLGLMGGISNFSLLRETPDDIRRQAQAAVAGGINIVGPECAIPLATPVANLKAIAAIGRGMPAAK
jgi:MtaA/CmuA family methyltransferase